MVVMVQLRKGIVYGFFLFDDVFEVVSIGGVDVNRVVNFI